MVFLKRKQKSNKAKWGISKPGNRGQLLLFIKGVFCDNYQYLSPQNTLYNYSSFYYYPIWLLSVDIPSSGSSFPPTSSPVSSS